MRRLLVLLLLGVTAWPAAAAPSPSPSPALEPARGVSVVPAPTTPHRSKSGTLLELGTVALGTPVVDSVVVRSTFDEPKAVLLYATDARPAVGGGFGFGARTETPKEVGAWTQLSTGRVQVPAQGEVTVRLTVVVPTGAPGGEYVGAVIAEPEDQGAGGALQTRTRFAMALYLRVPGGAPAATPGRGIPGGTVHLDGVDPRFEGGRVCPVVRYRNDSQDVVDPKVTVRARGLLGSGTSYRRERTGALLPGATAAVSLPCLRRPLGPGKLEVTLRSPRGNAFEAVRSTWLPLPLLLSLLLLLLLLAALLGTFVRGLLRRADRNQDSDAAGRSPS